MQYEACADLRNASLRNQLRDSLCSAHGIALMVALSQFGDFLRVAGDVGSDATAEAVDGRAKAIQLDIVDSKDRECGMVASESFFDSTRRMIGFCSRLRGGWLCPCRVRKWLN